MSQTILISRSELCKLFIVSRRLFRNGLFVRDFPNLYLVLPENQSFDTRMLWIGLRGAVDEQYQKSKIHAGNSPADIN